MPKRSTTRFTTPTTMLGVTAIVILAGVIAVLGFGAADGTPAFTGDQDMYVSPSVEQLRMVARKLTEHPNDPALLFQFAQARLRIPADSIRHLIDSADALRQACELDPSHPPTWKKLATILATTRRVAEATAAAEKAIQLDPTDDEAALLLTTLLLRSDQKGEATRRLENFVDRTPTSWRLRLLHVGLIPSDQLTPLYSWSIESELEELSNHDGRLRLAIVALHQRLGQTERAQNQLETCLEQGPTDPGYLLALAQMASTLGRRDALLELVDRHPEQLQHDELALAVARACWQQDDPQALLDRLGNQELDPCATPETVLLIALSLRRTGKIVMSTQQLRQASQYAAISTGWRRLFEVFAESPIPSPSVTEEAVRQALSATPRSALLNYLRAQAWLKMGEWRLARRSAAQAARLAPTWYLAPLIRANASLQLGEAAIAKRCAETAYRLAPQYSEVVLMKATVEILCVDRDRSDEVQRLRDQLDLLGTVLPEDQLPRVHALQSLLERKASDEASNDPPARLAADQLVDISQLDDTRFVEGASITQLVKARQMLLEDQSARQAAKTLLALRPTLGTLPNDLDALLLSAYARVRLGDDATAIDQFEEVFNASTYRASQVLRLSLRLRLEGHWRHPSSLVRLWETTGPIDSSSDVENRLRLLAEFAEQTQDERLAIATYRRLLALHPDISMAANNLAVWLARNSASLAEAQVLSQRANEQEPSNVEYQQTLASIMQAQQQRSQPVRPTRGGAP